MAIVIKRVDGGVSIMKLIPAMVEMVSVVEETLGQLVLVEVLPDVEAEVEKWKASHPGEYVSHREMPDEAIPTDRSTRAAWRDSSPELVIDVDLAASREARIADIDRQIAAIEQKELAPRLLRDITTAVVKDAATRAGYNWDTLTTQQRTVLMPGYPKFAAVEAQIATLRQLRGQV